MRINGESAEFRLDRGRTLEVGDARDWRVVCRRGVLWVTQDRLPEDVVLVPEQTFRLSRRGPTLIHAFEDAEFRLELAQRPWREELMAAIRAGRRTGLVESRGPARGLALRKATAAPPGPR